MLVSVLTDLSAPDPLAGLSMQISSEGTVLFDNADEPWRLGPGQSQRLPGSFRLVADGGEPEVTVSVQGRDRSGRPLVIRTASLRMARDQTLLLRMALSRQCLPRELGGELAEPCAEGLTCVEGRCLAPDEAATLVAYREGADDEVACSAQASTFIDTESGEPLTAPAAGCAAPKVCQEGLCVSAGAPVDAGPADVTDSGDASDLTGADVDVGGIPFDCSGGPCVAELGNYGLGFFGITVGADGNLWLSGAVGGATRVTTAGEVTRFKSVNVGYSWGLAATPDGALWFTVASPCEQTSGNQIVRVDTTTTPFTETLFPMPAGTCPESIIVGPDDNLWFTSSMGVGRMTPGGEVTPLMVSAGQFGSVTPALTIGPDGNVWVTQPAYSDNAIARITPAGEVTQFPVPTAQAGPNGICTGPDGNLWFTEFAAGKIGRLTVDGVFTEWALPSSARQDPRYITPGPDGNLWATLSNQLARVTPAGEITIFPVPGNDLYGIVAGPDGNLWFAEHFSGYMAKVGVLQPP